MSDGKHFKTFCYLYELVLIRQNQTSGETTIANQRIWELKFLFLLLMENGFYFYRIYISLKKM